MVGESALDEGVIEERCDHIIKARSHLCQVQQMFLTFSGGLQVGKSTAAFSSAEQYQYRRVTGQQRARYDVLYLLPSKFADPASASNSTSRMSDPVSETTISRIYQESLAYLTRCREADFQKCGRLRSLSETAFLCPLNFALPFLSTAVDCI